MENMVAPCGIYCCLCHAYQRRNCPGCRHKSDEVRKSRLSRVILKCDKYAQYCYECGKPCKRLLSLDSRYRTRYDVSPLDNLHRIRADGVETFVERQNQKYKCVHCGGLRTVHYGYCIYCKMNKRRKAGKE